MPFVVYSTQKRAHRSFLRSSSSLESPREVEAIHFLEGMGREGKGAILFKKRKKKKNPA